MADEDGSMYLYGGEGGIRTLEAPFGRPYDFQSYSFGLSDTSPREWGRRVKLRIGHAGICISRTMRNCQSVIHFSP